MSMSGYFSNPDNQYWIGNDGNVYVRTTDGQTINAGTADINNTAWVNAVGNGITAKRIPNPGNPGTTATADVTAGSAGAGASTLSAADLRQQQQDALDAAERGTLKAGLKGRAGEVDQVYGDLFGSLDSVVKARDAQLESQYGDQFKSAGDKYAEAIPQIETSYAAIGAGDSTDNTYAKVGAKKGFEDTTATIGKNKSDDKAKLGAYSDSQKAKITADQNKAHEQLNLVDGTNDLASLRGMRDALSSNLSDAGITKATLTTDGQASKDLSALTSDSGRYESAVNALDGILKSSLSGGVKQAAVEAVTTNAGLSDEEKKKIQTTYGNVYAEQAAI